MVLPEFIYIDYSSSFPDILEKIVKSAGLEFRKLDENSQNGLPIVYGLDIHSLVDDSKLQNPASGPILAIIKSESLENEDVVRVAALFDSYSLVSDTPAVFKAIISAARKRWEIRKQLEAREIMLKELPHRIKNSFAISASLLSLASDKTYDPRDIPLFLESRDRINVLGLLYDKLLITKSEKTLLLEEYIRDISNSLCYAYGINDFSVRIDCSDIEIGSANGIYLGLIINEAITNSIKYRDGPRLVLEIVASPDSNEKSFSLRISDRGIGIPADFSLEKADSLGILLMQTLSSQMGAGFSIKNRDGEGTILEISGISLS